MYLMKVKAPAESKKPYDYYLKYWREFPARLPSVLSLTECPLMKTDWDGPQDNERARQIQGRITPKRWT
jgi:hypothetical protein